MSLRVIHMTAAIGAAILVAGCDDATRPRTLPIEETFAFLESLEGWSPRAIEVVVGDDDEIDWEIARSEERSVIGPASVRLFVDNRTDAARLWIEREFQLEADADYDVRIEFAFATADWSDVNLWRVLAGPLSAQPQAASDLEPAHQDDTRAGTPPGEGYVWQHRRYDAAVRSGGDGVVFIVIGIWGTSEFQRTYFIDDVRLVFTRL